jgi:hypothetical protein
MSTNEFPCHLLTIKINNLQVFNTLHILTEDYTCFLNEYSKPTESAPKRGTRYVVGILSKRVASISIYETSGFRHKFCEHF